MQDPKDIHKVDNWHYLVPIYEITNEGIKSENGASIFLCRGDRNNETSPRQAGLFTETLLEVCRQYLESVNTGELRNRDTSLAITHIEDALLRLEKRQNDRKKRNVQATYKA